MSTTHLARNPNDRWIGGVCGGIARWLGWNADAVRLLYVLFSVFSVAFPGAIVYIILYSLAGDAARRVTFSARPQAKLVAAGGLPPRDAPR